jgi:ubiquinone/menaquinone biosynthesis C-methylase UbiE
MRIQEIFLLSLIKSYHSEWDKGHPLVKAEVGSKNHEIDYAMLQLKKKIISGLGADVYQKKVLEIGCGQGGICIFAALVGAKEVVGIDLSDSALETAEKLKVKVQEETGFQLNVSFNKMFAENLKFENGELDVIIADNVFEHVKSLEVVMNECSRVLNRGGKIIVPNFPSFRSKFGPHVKYGIRLPWVHILFSEKTVVKVMHMLAEKDPQMHHFYPGLKLGATTFQEVRAYKDLNYISNKIFSDTAEKTGFNVESFFVTRPRWAWLLMKAMPFLRKTALEDILSIGTTAILVKK